MAKQNSGKGTLEGRTAMVRTFIGNGYIQWVAGAEKAIVFVEAARALGFKAAYEFNYTGRKMCSDAQRNLVYARLREEAGKNGRTLEEVEAGVRANRANYVPAA